MFAKKTRPCIYTALVKDQAVEEYIQQHHLFLLKTNRAFLSHVLHDRIDIRTLPSLVKTYKGEWLGRVDVWLYGSMRLAVVHHKDGLRNCSEGYIEQI